MSESYCDLCKEFVSGTVQTVKILDNDQKTSHYISGHVSCTEDIWKQIQEMKDFNKKSLSKVLKELNIE
ncbi:hypothetical protein AF332_11970 [Sporosarcina globispora]|uniref:Uncharacterized protein n=1 Tax=Sporosarcina globispora TaxID=1459 RepID=A0A0M0GCL4_SPOGL|nr:hypothetical protein [Sporosarcina globispora]KON87473.1 hypothetical protein AF332_11970 [Sporosarcina globispora]